MARILIRAGKSPFEAVDPLTCHHKNLIASNSGNILFAQSVYKALSTSDNELICNQYKVSRDADFINNNYDAFVIPLANAFRPSFSKQLDALTALIRQLKIPCVVVGVGAQTNLKLDMLRSSPIDDSVKNFVSAVLDRSTSIGVRGELTREYLARLGFTAVDTIGCPSMYLHGGRIDVRKTREKIGPESSVSMNLTRGMNEPTWQLFRRTWKRYPKLTYVAQDRSDFEYLYWGRPIIDGIKKGDAFPSKINHPLYTSDRIRMYVDAKTWLDGMKAFEFAFGTRIHGNVFALLAGTPAVVLAHDSRTLELSQFYDIPHIRTDDINEDTDASTLFEAADFANLMTRLPSRFEFFKSFLEKNGLKHMYDGSDAEVRFERRLETTKLPPPIRPILSCGPKELSARIASLHQDIERLIQNH